jgi:hypothetical protein
LTDQEDEEDIQALSELLRNATAKKCPDCECEKVDKAVDADPPYEDLLCTCTDCGFEWCLADREEIEQVVWIRYGAYLLSETMKKNDGEHLTDDKEKAINPAAGTDCYLWVRKDLDCTIWVLKNKTEYDRLEDLSDYAHYNYKLMSQYGHDVKTGKWDPKRFPVSQTDAQCEGALSDIRRSWKALHDFNEYKEYLARKYHLDLEEANKCNTYAIRCPIVHSIWAQTNDLFE